jgi:transcriptional regulator with XRE-family HTH domain
VTMVVDIATRVVVRSTAMTSATMTRVFDATALYAALESRKDREHRSWRQLAELLGVSDHTVFTRLAKGQAPGVDVLLKLCGWLDASIEDFTDHEPVLAATHDAAARAVRERLGDRPGLPPQTVPAARAELDDARARV